MSGQPPWQEKLLVLERRYEDLERRLADPAVLADREEWESLVREHARLGPLAAAFRRWRQVQEDLRTARSLLAEAEPEAAVWLAEQVSGLEEEGRRLEGELLGFLAGTDPRDEKNVIVEIRAGAGGEEAALFAGDLLRMYARYAERRGWTVEVLSGNETGLGGFKEVAFLVRGQGAYSRLKYESGVHRVQRVPVTEAGGRIHTSTATVAVLAEADEVDVVLRPEDLRIETFRAGGHGGQHVNKTESAVRVTHLPTGITVSCQDERSQHKNRARALAILRARLFDRASQEREAALAAERRTQVGTGERSEKIRTYNFPQGRVTDHRAGVSLHRLAEIMDGDLDELLDAVAAHQQAAALAAAD